MKKTIIAGLGLAIAVGGGAMLRAADSTTVTGHLRDGYCYTIMGAKGPSHKQCAIGCASKGIPVLLVEDKTDKSYVLLPAKDDSALPPDVISKMEDDVTVTGKAYSKNGINFFQVESVK
jgi:hypothetical protein